MFVENYQPHSQDIDCIYVSLLDVVPRETALAVLSSSLLYSEPSRQILLLESFKDTYSAAEIAREMLKEAFSSSFLVNSLYVSFLSLIPSLDLSGDDIAHIMFAWLRFFEFARHDVEFRQLFRAIYEAKKSRWTGQEYNSELLFHKEIGRASCRERVSDPV